jgi:hypothetical protein
MCKKVTDCWDVGAAPAGQNARRREHAVATEPRNRAVRKEAVRVLSTWDYDKKDQVLV